MCYFKHIIGVLLVGASLVCATANPRGDADGFCTFNETDGQRLVQIVEEGDNPAPLAEMLEGCQRLVFGRHLQPGLQFMIRLHRHAIFRYLLPLIECRVPGFTRSQFLGGILGMALGCNSIEIADYLLDQGARVQSGGGRTVWLAAAQGVWNLDDLKGLISRHPEYAVALTPTGADIARAGDEDDVRVLVGLSRHCDALSGQATFDATFFMVALLSSDAFIQDEELARMALRLYHEGAELNQTAREWFELHPEAYQLFSEWATEDVKEPDGN